MPSPAPQIALIEDDAELAELTQERLQREGFAVTHVADGEAAIEHILAQKPDLVVLDIMLPGVDGFEVCRRVRSGGYRAPILILTARDDDVDEILGLELGADDFVTKPVKPRLLIARIRALLRRARPQAPTSTLTVGALTIDGSRREVSVAGTQIELTTVEFDLLTYLTSHAGQVVSRQEIYQALFHYDYDGLDRSVDVYVSRLRRKLGDDPAAPHYLKTVRGAGYLMAGQAS